MRRATVHPVPGDRSGKSGRPIISRRAGFTPRISPALTVVYRRNSLSEFEIDEVSMENIRRDGGEPTRVLSPRGLSELRSHRD